MIAVSDRAHRLRAYLRSHPFWGGALGFVLAWLLWGRWVTLAATRDLFLWASLSGRSAREPNVVFLTVGDEDLARYASREAVFLDRRTYARAIDRLVDHGAGVIVFDVLFDRPSPNDPQADATLARSIESSGRTILARCFTKDPSSQVTKLLEPIPELSSKACSLGFVNVANDADGVIRSVKLIAQQGDRLVRHVALEAAIRYRGAARTIRPLPSGFLVGVDPRSSFFVPCGRDGRSFVDYASLPETPRIALKDLLESKDQAALHRSLLKDKIVIVGSVSPLLKDRHAFTRNWFSSTPSLEDGAWFLAAFTENVLSGNLMRDVTPPPGLVIALIFAAASCAFVVLAVSRGAVVAMVAVGTAWTLSSLLHSRGLVVDAFGVTLSVACLYGCPSLIRVLVEKRRLARLTAELSQEIGQVRRELERVSAAGRVAEPGELPSYLDGNFISRFIPSRYKDLSHLGQGGMGVVFRAKDEQLGTEVAIKVLSPLVQDNPNAVKRFMVEGHTLQKLDHPGLVKVTDIQYKPLSFFVMEYVDGQPLDLLVSENEKLPVMQALDVAYKVAQVLGYIHDKGMIHRDIKPSNLIQTADGTVKLIDFGLVHDEDATAITQSGDVLGTLKYMAPEQFAGGKCAAASDVYSVGVMLCQFMTGQTPQRQGYMHQSPREFLVTFDIPEPVIGLLERCISMYVDWRPKDGNALAQEIAVVKAQLAGMETC